MTEFERALMALREDTASFNDFATDTRNVWRRFARYLERRWRLPLGVDIEDVEQELLFAGWRAVKSWDPGRGVAIDRYVRFQALDKAKKWLHKQREAKRRDGSAPTRAPTVFTAFERPDDEAGSAQDALAWVGPDEIERTLSHSDAERELAWAFEPYLADLPWRDREVLARVVASAGDLDEAVARLVEHAPTRQALRIGSSSDAHNLAARVVARVLAKVSREDWFAEVRETAKEQTP